VAVSDTFFVIRRSGRVHCGDIKGLEFSDLDEGTARMHPVVWVRERRAIEGLLRDRIGIVIAHRLSSVRRCDEVVVLADGEVIEAGPLRTSQRFARLLASSHVSVPAGASSAGRVEVGVGTRRPLALADRDDFDGDAWPGADQVRDAGGAPTMGDGAGGGTHTPVAVDAGLTVPPKADPPPLPAPARAHTLREIFRLATNDARFGLGAVVLFLFMVLLGLDGSVLPWLWADLVDGAGGLFWPAAAIVAALLITAPMPYYTGKLYPEWWVRQMLRIGLRLVHGQTGPRRVSAHSPAEVVAQGGDNERVTRRGVAGRVR